ncbi:hypothetical protein SLEP1_g42771 [Rubroshorea leprosula]|uniref:Retrovirus-related Pol polyprotein from transposon RE2 n=1 Tax=Rubroshorea leprosula TaxID=152421 RepID=A0AAV5LAX6_9ROSI|nr:hypothetical protein SLEP1_g42771 [Rubroshorea leprosula]
MADVKPISTPMAFAASSLNSISMAFSDGTDYRQVFMHCPTDTHWQVTKHVLRYLKRTSCHSLLLCPQSSLLLHAFSDTDWVGDRATCVSTIGYIVFLGSNPISWHATKPKAVACSSTEAEYHALVATTFELLWVGNLLSELGVPVLASLGIFYDTSVPPISV